MGAIALVGYGALVPGLGAPDEDRAMPAPTALAEIAASLTYSGQDVSITGSVQSLFTSQEFRGPNRTAKTSRERIIPDPAEFSKGFEGIRTQIAALRAAPPAINPTDATRLATAPQPDVPAVAVAALDADASAALDAINALATPDQVVPMPMSTPTQLAYARENAPIAERETPPHVLVGAKEMECLATAIYFEARGESYRGQAAVAQVVMNRTKHRLYPSTICGVVFQNQHKRNACQFSFACDGIPERINDRRAWAQAEEIAQEIVDNKLYLTEVADATHYHATYVYPHWAPKMTKVSKVGLHVFYKFKRGWSFG